jgi:hypothetical protein
VHRKKAGFHENERAHGLFLILNISSL